MSANLPEIARLFVELFFAWCNNGVPRGPLEECGLDPSRHSDWDCCDLHRGLKREYTALKRMAEVFDVQSAGATLSLQWLKDFALQYNFELPNANRPSWVW